MPAFPAPHRGRPRGVAGLIASLAFALCASPLAIASPPSPVELDEAALRAVNARGLADHLFLAQETEQPDFLRLLNPAQTFLDADVRARGLTAPRTTLHADGTLEVQMVGTIEEIRFDNVRPRGAPREQSFGSLRFEQVNFAGSNLRIRQLP